MTTVSSRIWTVLLFVWLQNCTTAIHCINQDGDVVEWWVIYKTNHGTNYAYYDATNIDKTLNIVPNSLLSDDNTAVAYTLNQIWKNPMSYNYIAYNDEPPDGSSGESYGHTKGVFGYDDKDQTGFFLIHSWPKFPSFYGSSYNIGTISTTYAQTFLCISYKGFDKMNSISYQLRFNKPKVYNSSNTFTSTNNFTEILDKKWLANTSIYSFQSLNNVESFTHFAKSGKWDNDLYEYLVSPYYQQSFIWETWRRNPSEPSFCQPQYVFDELNVESVVLNDGTQWKYTQDHGKSGCSIISSTSDKPFVCIGDINRMYSQYSRGGGTACFEHQNLWTAFNSAFTNHDKCSS